MERLLSDAEKLSGKKYDISNLNDVYEAIHVVQTEMGITGTTAKEASTTIQGSIGMLKTSWQNLVTGLADKNADVGKLAKDVIDSISTVAKNVLPIITNLLPQVSTALAELVNTLIPMLPPLFSSVLPALISGSISIIETLVSTLAENAGTLLDAGGSALMQIVDGIGQAIPSLMDSAFSIIQSIVETLGNGESLQRLLDSALKIVTEIAQGLAESLPQMIPAVVNVILQIVKTLTEPDSLMKLLRAALDIIVAIGEGLIAAIPTLVKNVPEIINNLVMALQDGWGEIANAGKQLVLALWKGIKEAWEGLKDWFSGLWNGLFGNKTVSVNAKTTVNGSHANGLNYVPFDGYIAQLHKGEMVVPAALASSLRSAVTINGGKSTPVSVNDLRGVMSTAVNAMSTAGGAASGDLYIEIPVDGQKFYRATIKDFRRVSKAMPEVFA